MDITDEAVIDMDNTDEERLFRRYYVQLLNTIQIESLLPVLYNNDIITFEQKQSIGSNEINFLPRQWITRLLDEVIYRSLGTSCRLFDGFLYAMQYSQDRLSQELAKQILAIKYPSSPDSKLTIILYKANK